MGYKTILNKKYEMIKMYLNLCNLINKLKITIYDKPFLVACHIFWIVIGNLNNIFYYTTYTITREH